MARGEQWKTAFRTRYGLCEYEVMPSRVASAPNSFQKCINDTLRGFLDDFVTAYVVDILIFGENELEHEIRVRQVF